MAHKVRVVTEFVHYSTVCTLYEPQSTVIILSKINLINRITKVEKNVFFFFFFSDMEDSLITIIRRTLMRQL